MTKEVETAFDRTFSEPPNVGVTSSRTHCEACKEPLDPAVMHRCVGNQEWKPDSSFWNNTVATPVTEDDFVRAAASLDAHAAVLSGNLPPASPHPDLTNYKGVCPECHGKHPEPDSQTQPCSLCGGKGVIE